MTFRCIYCAEEKKDSEKSNEHVWPAAMGGNKLPNKFQINQCCKRCNNNLGLFVDSAFYHQFMVYHDHMLPQLGFLKPPEPKFVPSHYLGNMKDHQFIDRTIENWAGPRGENIYFIHSNDREEFQGVAKGNSIRRKSDPGRVYFAITKQETYWFWIALNSIVKTFPDAKVFCFTEVIDNAEAPKVSEVFNHIHDKSKFPDEEISFFRQHIHSNETTNSQFQVDLSVWSRFAAKVAIGFGFVYFGNFFFQHPNYETLKNSLNNSTMDIEQRPNHIARYVLATEGDDFPPKTSSGTRIQIVQTTIGLSIMIVFQSGNKICILLEGKANLNSENICGEHYLISPGSEKALEFNLAEITNSIPRFKPDRMIALEKEMRSAKQLDIEVEQMEKQYS